MLRPKPVRETDFLPEKANMTICDRCKNLDAKCLAVFGILDTNRAFDGADGHFQLDLCRACFDKLRDFVGKLPQKGKPNA